LLINERDVKKALSVHENFLKKTQTTQFVCDGSRKCGEKFIEQIHHQRNFLKRKIEYLRVIALSNSRKSILMKMESKRLAIL
jgi:hypothetical protein